MPIYSTISAKAIPTPQRPNISFYPLEKSSSDPVRTKEQVTQRAAQQIGDSPPRQMMRAVVDQVTALTKTAQVAQPVVGRIMIEVRRGQHHMRCPHLRDLFQVRPAGDAAAAVAPGVLRRIEPPPIRQAAYGGSMRPAAALAHAARPLEANTPAKL